MPSVVFAGPTVLSYRTDDADANPPWLNSVSVSGSSRADGEIGDGLLHAAAIDACPADDDEAGAPRDVLITLFFTSDSASAQRTGDYTLWRQRNDSTPVPLVRHLQRDGSRAFLEYRYVLPSGTGDDSLAVVPSVLLPISRRDTMATAVDVRALRAVEWHFLVRVAPPGLPSRMVRVQVLTSLPPMNQLDRHECRAPVESLPLLATAGSPAPPRIVDRS